jgi:hypothetical protein
MRFVGWVERSDTHHVSAQGFDGYRFAPPILRESFRLAENTAKTLLLRALPLLTPCGMIAPKFFKAAGNAAREQGGLREESNSNYCLRRAGNVGECGAGAR